MPIYHFDVVENGRQHRDRHGILLASADVAHAEAVAVATALIRDRMFELDSHEVVITARTEEDAEVCTVRLSVHSMPEEQLDLGGHLQVSMLQDRA